MGGGKNEKEWGGTRVESERGRAKEKEEMIE